MNEALARATALVEMANIRSRREQRAKDEAEEYEHLRALWKRWRRKIPTAEMAEASGVTVAAIRKQWQ